MRGKDFSTGLRGGLFEQRHCARTGASIWLYGWLVLRQTSQHDGLGWVLGGSPITYREIEEETGFNPRTLERWMRDLRRGGYIETQAVPSGIVVRITKAKKFPQFAQGGRRNEGGLRRVAEGAARNCVADGGKPFSGQQVTGGIGSSFIERAIEKRIKSEIHRDFHGPQENPQSTQKHTEKPSCRDQNQNTPSGPWRRERDYRQLFIEAIRGKELLRAQRDEEVRRELAVGTGPEVIRS
jgi:hypothetical protein